MGKCAGEEFAAFAGMGILSSYLVLFISFYIATYNKSSKGNRPRRNTGKQSLIDMKDYELPSVSEGQNQNGAAKPNGQSTVANGRSNGPITRSRRA